MSRAIVVILGLTGFAWGYIAVDGRRLTLGEVILEFPHVATLEVERTDAARGAFLLKRIESHLGDKDKVPLQFALFQGGKLPTSLSALKSGSRCIVFAGSPDNRSLVRVEGMWFITKPEGGWERLNALRPDLDAIFSGSVAELADALTRYRTGRVAEIKSGSVKVRYDAEQPHRRFIVLDEGDALKRLKDSSADVRQWAATRLGEKPIDPKIGRAHV